MKVSWLWEHEEQTPLCTEMLNGWQLIHIPFIKWKSKVWIMVWLSLIDAGELRQTLKELLDWILSTSHKSWSWITSHRPRNTPANETQKDSQQYRCHLYQWTPGFAKCWTHQDFWHQGITYLIPVSLRERRVKLVVVMELNHISSVVQD